MRLDRLLWMQRNLYNRALEERKDAWQQEHRSISRFEQFASLNGIAEREPELGCFGVCVARGTLTRLELAFQAFYRRCRRGETPGYPRFKGRYRFDSVSYPDASGWRLDSRTRRVRLLGVGEVKAKLHRPLPVRPKTAVVKREGCRWWLIVQCDQVPPRPLPATGRAVGVDVGVASILTTSDGEQVGNPRPGRAAAERLARAQHDLAAKTAGSNRRRRAAGRVAACHRKAARRRRDVAHKISRDLVDRYDLIAVEDLRITNMVHRPAPRPALDGSFEPNEAAAKAGLNRSIHDAGWGQLLRFVTYKAEEAGRELIAVDPRNTSRTCHLRALREGQPALPGGVPMSILRPPSPRRHQRRRQHSSGRAGPTSST